MQFLTLSFLKKLRWLAPLLLRGAIGVSFFWFHGRPKLLAGEGWETWDWGQDFASKGSPAFLYYIAAFTEFLGGAALLLGLLTRLAAVGLMGVMLYAIFEIHLHDPYKAKELAIAYASGCLALAVIGPGPLSLDRLFFGKDP